jgi:uncharacterized membrane protein
MRANSLLEKGILSRDDAVFNKGIDNFDKIITEFEAMQNLIGEYRVLHFFLIVVHTIVAFGITAHMMIVVRDFKTEAKLCILVNPSSYFFMLMFSLATVFGSILAVRHSSRRQLFVVFFRKQRKIHFLSIGFVMMMVLSTVGGSTLCKIKRKQSYWPIIWIIFSFLQAMLLISYTKWFIEELKDLGFTEEEEENKKGNSDNQSTSDGNKSYDTEMPSIGTRTRQPSNEESINTSDMTLNSITTV